MEHDEARERLAAEQQRLQSAPPSEHQAGEAPQEHDFSILEQVEAELADVERALQRLDDGSYGTCEACGGTIADERLEAMPAARLCAQHETG